MESPFNDMVWRCWLKRMLGLPFVFVFSFDGEVVMGADTTRFVGRRGMGELVRPLPGPLALTVPASLRWNQCSNGLLDR